jgi:hypothetical protein
MISAKGLSPFFHIFLRIELGENVLTITLHSTVF